VLLLLSFIYLGCKNDTDVAQVDKKTFQQPSFEKSFTSDGKWQLDLIFEKPNFTSIGISRWKEYSIISDSASDIIYTIDTRARTLFDSTLVESPVYINQTQNRCLIPSYNNDSIYIFRGRANNQLEVFEELDGPTAVFAFRIDHYAILDQKNNRLLYKNGPTEKIVGSKGHGKGELDMPTNFELVEGTKAYVLDAGNKRVQVFNLKTGEALFDFGQEQNFQHISGITSDVNRIFVSDAEKGVIYIYDKEGNYLDQITELINNPSDIEMNAGYLYIANQNGPEIIILKEVIEAEN